MNKTIKVSISDAAKFSKIDLNILVSTSVSNDESTYLVDLGGGWGGVGDWSFKFSNKKDLIEFKNKLDALINEILNQNL